MTIGDGTRLGCVVLGLASTDETKASESAAARSMRIMRGTHELLKEESGLFACRARGRRIRGSGWRRRLYFPDLSYFDKEKDLVSHPPTMPGLKAQSGNAMSSSSSSRALRRFLFCLAIARRFRV